MSQDKDTAQPKYQEQQSHHDRGATVLVVDDDLFNRELVERFLTSRGYRVITGSSGAEGLNALELESIDIVLLDVLMPDMNGFEVLAKIRETFSITELPVIMASGLDSTEDLIRALKLGANDYVTKPIDFRLAEARLETQLALKRASDEVKRLNAKLEQAHQRIIRLVGSTSTALTDMAAWSRSLANELADAIGVRGIGVWALEQERLSELCSENMVSPRIVDLAMILKGTPLERERDTVVPVIGYTDELQGALVVPGHDADWAPQARELLEAFARQLGGALEMRRTKAQLAGYEDEFEEEDDGLEDSTIGRRHFKSSVVQVCRLCGLCYEEAEQHCRDCGPGALLHSPWPIPHHIGDRYRLTQVLGKGGMGVVFAAADDRLNREVAIKVINPDYLGRRTIRARFKQEAQAIASIQNPGVVSVHDFGELENGAIYIVMERLFGLDLEYLVKNCGPGTPKEVGAFLRQGAQALDAAHQAKIIHRDIKPGNFYLVPNNKSFRVKVLDFGLARRLTVNADITRAGIIVGTPVYMSPEQAMGRPLDHRSDVYSFAAVSFQALVGHPTTQQKKYARILEDVVRTPPPAVSSSVSNMPRKVDKAFAWALAKRPEDRPKSAGAWVDAFVSILESVPTMYRGWRRRKGLRGIDPVQ